jgi:hypothetical protein
MYFMVIVLFLLVFPLASVAIEAVRFHENLTNLVLSGRWWAFWTVGVRLFFRRHSSFGKPDDSAKVTAAIARALLL